jgi:hypothetical protein
MKVVVDKRIEINWHWCGDSNCGTTKFSLQVIDRRFPEPSADTHHVQSFECYTLYLAACSQALYSTWPSRSQDQSSSPFMMLDSGHASLDQRHTSPQRLRVIPSAQTMQNILGLMCPLLLEIPLYLLHATLSPSTLSSTDSFSSSASDATCFFYNPTSFIY